MAQPEPLPQKVTKRKETILAYLRRKYLRVRARWYIGVLLFPLRKKYRFTTSALTISLLSLLAFIYLMKSKQAEIRAQLTGLGDIDFTYSAGQQEGISPLCGCYDEQPREEWRGITFPARYIQIARKGPKPLTGYMMTAAEPAHTQWWSSMFELQGSIYVFAIPAEQDFDPRLLLTSTFPDSYRLLDSRKYDNARYFMLISTTDLNIALLGDKPLGSWIPADGSQVSIRYQMEGMHLNARNVAIIEEHYRNTEINVETATVPAGVPLGDFLGPHIVCWSEDKSAVLVARDDVLQLNQPLQKTEKVIWAILTEPSFSLRVAADPMERELVDTYVESLKEYNSSPKHEEVQTSGVGHMVVGQLDDGTVTVSVIDSEKQSEEFEVVYSQMKENDVVYRRVNVDARMDGQPYRKSWVMNFRYPPIPPNRGFNIFGPINSMTFSKALGSLALGTRNIDINVPSKLDFRDIRSLDLDRGVFTVPIQLNTAEGKAKIQLKATSQAYLNDQPLNRVIDEYRIADVYLPAISIGVTLLSLAVGLWSLRRR